MNPHMTVEEARTVQREPVVVGGRYRFYSDCVECKSSESILIRRYSGQLVNVLSKVAHPEEDWEIFNVRAVNGDTFNANGGELNGWIFDTGQWVGPRIF